MIVNFLQKFSFGEEFFIAAFGGILCTVEPPLNGFHVRENELEIDRADIANGIDGVFDVCNVFVFEAAHDMDDRVDFADMGKEFIAQSFAVRCALDKSRNVDKFDDGRCNFFAVVKSGELVQPFIGNGDDADVGFDGAERIIGGFCARMRDGVKECGFSDVRKTDDT